MGARAYVQVRSPERGRARTRDKVRRKLQQHGASSCHNTFFMVVCAYRSSSTSFSHSRCDEMLLALNFAACCVVFRFSFVTHSAYFKWIFSKIRNNLDSNSLKFCMRWKELHEIRQSWAEPSQATQTQMIGSPVDFVRGMIKINVDIWYDTTW